MTEVNYKKWEIIEDEQDQQIQTHPLKKIKQQLEPDDSQEEQIQPNQSKWEEKQKQIQTYLQCVLDSDYLMHLSQIMKIYSIDIKNTEICDKIKQNSRVQYIEQQKIQNIFRFSTRKQFYKSFSQHTRKVHQSIILLIEKFYINNQRSQQIKKQKLRITILSNEIKILHIYSNIAQSFEKFIKLLQNRFRRLKKITCVEVGIKQKVVKLKLFKALHSICQNVIYMGFLCDAYQNIETSQKVTSEYGSNLGGLQLVLSQYQSMIFISQNNFSTDQQIKSIDKISKLVKIQNLLMNIFTKSTPLSIRLFYQNQYCCSIFAFYFNLIKNYDQMEIKQQAALSIQNKGINQIIKSLQKFDDLKRKQKNNGKMCYPKLMSVSKKCWVCKKSKPKYICQGCSEDYDLDIYLCVDSCFKQFHKYKDKYISKVEEHIKMRKLQSLQQQEVDKQILKTQELNPPKTMQEYQYQNKILEQEIQSSRRQIFKDSKEIINTFLINYQKNQTHPLFQKGEYLLRIMGLRPDVQSEQSQLESGSMEIQDSQNSLSIKNQEIVDKDSIFE